MVAMNDSLMEGSGLGGGPFWGIVVETSIGADFLQDFRCVSPMQGAALYRRWGLGA
jgi:hypothetical protein